MLDKKVSTIQIDATNCYQVVLKTMTSQQKEIILEGRMDGEYSPDLQMNTVTNGNTMFVNAGFRPTFKLPNDKLGAHKVVSISLIVVVPEGKDVVVYGTSASVSAYGTYGKLNIILSDGNCSLKNRAHETVVRTQNGPITLFAASGMVQADSKYGKVDNNPIPVGPDHFTLNSITGDIHLYKTE